MDKQYNLSEVRSEPFFVKCREILFF